MSNDPKKNRDAGSGKYVSQDYADQHKDTTVSETGDQMVKLLKQLTKSGGAIIRSSDLSDDDLRQAVSDGRYANGFVYVPIEE